MLDDDDHEVDKSEATKESREYYSRALVDFEETNNSSFLVLLSVVSYSDKSNVSQLLVFLDCVEELDDHGQDDKDTTR